MEEIPVPQLSIYVSWLGPITILIIIDYNQLHFPVIVIIINFPETI